MRTSELINELATALAAAQGEMKNAKFNRQNPHFKSRYADLAEIRDTVTPTLSAHGLAIIQGTETLDSGIVVVTKLVHKSGQWVESRFPIAYDKPQVMGSAYSYARRYSLAAICSIASEEDDDGNAASEKALPASKVKPDLPAGTVGASKASSRSLYEQLIGEMEKANSIEALEKWAELRGPDIKKLPADWLPEFREAYLFRRSSVAGV